MFGYVVIDKYEMKYKDYLWYKKLYCSVCHSLTSSIGLVGGILTSYDATLLLAVFDGLCDDCNEIHFRCPLNIFKKVDAVVSEKAMQYVAMITAIYAIAKFKDNAEDDKSITARIVYREFQKNIKVKNLLALSENTISLLYEKLAMYSEAEKSRESFDVLSNRMGELFGEAVKGFAEFSGNDDHKEELYQLGFYLGKWIYLADAFDDYFDDVNKKRFNALFQLTGYSELEVSDLSERVMTMSGMLLVKCYDATRTLSLRKNDDVVNNIILFGMPKKMATIKSNKYDISPKG